MDGSMTLLPEMVQTVAIDAHVLPRTVIPNKLPSLYGVVERNLRFSANPVADRRFWLTEFINQSTFRKNLFQEDGFGDSAPTDAPER
jgi:hypothetical protein